MRKKRMAAKGIFYFIFGVAFATLFTWTLVQGVMSHLSSGQYTLLYYFAAWFAGVGALTLYRQSKEMLHVAEISE
jgi:hypothetical protein